MKMDADPAHPAFVTVLGAKGDHRYPSQVLTVSGRLISMAGEIAIPVGMPVKVEWSQYLVYGEIMSVQEADQTFVVHIRHALTKADIEQIQEKWI